MSDSGSLEVGGKAIPRGRRTRINLVAGQLFDHTELSIPVEVIRGRRDGPVLFVSAALHGDEINGTEIIRRLLHRKQVSTGMKGTLIAVPIVNIPGYNNNSRYLPDRRDLNRCFPGSVKGSLGARIAHLLMEEVVSKATHGIDLHTGAIHRGNLPQIRAQLDDPETARLAQAFGVPVTINASVRDGSLRQAAAELGIPMLLYEGGEALRYDETAIRCGIAGILSVMEAIGMIGEQKRRGRGKKTVFAARSSYWVRAPHSGSLRVRKHLGALVSAREELGVITDPFGDRSMRVTAPRTGVIIGMTHLPLVNNGDALFHIATFEDGEAVEESLEHLDQLHS